MTKRIEIAENLIDTIECIVRSPLLEQYNIGITMRPVERKDQYRTWGPRNNAPTWPHFVILNTRQLKAKAALSLEEKLYGMIQMNKKSILFKKYRGDTKHGPYTPSLGGLKGDNNHRYYLYIAWANIGDN
ncbi:hypothetical protein A3197_17250 [Candidatus Thiodiazotropha endoloripes]|nr:hypothetical protein A3197_17250 [Candidatus Thiodiazotropha endoloripes]